MEHTARVAEYMTHEVVTVSPTDTVGSVTQLMSDTDGHNGFPVCSGQTVKGFVTSQDLLGVDNDTPIEEVMMTDILVANPEMRVTDCARVILRAGVRKLPVVDDGGELVGIIGNTDVIRSQIERATPEKVGKLSRTLTELHGTDLSRERRPVRLVELVPTQQQVYADELEGRSYELERGLAEPLVVIDNPGDSEYSGLFLADGHHRVLAARRLGIEEMEAYVITPERPIELGIARTASEAGLTSIDDIRIVDYARHPLVETIEQLQ